MSASDAFVAVVVVLQLGVSLGTRCLFFVTVAEIFPAKYRSDGKVGRREGGKEEVMRIFEAFGLACIGASMSATNLGLYASLQSIGAATYVLFSAAITLATVVVWVDCLLQDPLLPRTYSATIPAIAAQDQPSFAGRDI